MLLIENYCYKNNIALNTPICDKNGFLAYKVKTVEDDNLAYRFLHYSWDQGKSHPGYYVFKFYEVSETDKSNISCLVQDIAYYSWCDFFVEIEKIKSFILSCPEFFVADSAESAKILLWQAFIKTQDANLAGLYRLMPTCFYDSLDQTKSLTKQMNAHETFLDFLKNNNIILYNSWLYFIDINIKQTFCKWFEKYVNGSF
jgi:hypothetical protein